MPTYEHTNQFDIYVSLMYLLKKSCLLLGLIHFSSVLCFENIQNSNVAHPNDSLKSNSTNNRLDFSDYTKNLFSWNFYDRFQSGTQCKKHVEIIFQEARNLNSWALNMLDASAKLPSGILRGNLNQFGDFDECLQTKGLYQEHTINGKYCLLNIEITFPNKEKNEKLAVLDNLIHANRMLTNELKDLGHRIPRFETFNWGVCVPASCNVNDIQNAIELQLKSLSDKNLIEFKVLANEEVCYIKENKPFSFVHTFVQLLFVLIMCLIVTGTLVNLNKINLRNKKFEKILTCFSLKRNWQILSKTDHTNDDIKCLHGARFLNAIALLLSHKQIAMLFNPIPNRTEMSETFDKSWTMIGRSAILYTDSFIMFSGLLTSYSLIKDLDYKKKLNFKSKFVNRYIRFTPNLFATILFCTYIMDSMSSGPQWGLVVTKYSSLCKKHMWRNFLYIHNHFGFENMCLTHTHQLGIDMQLFLLSPIFVYTIWKSPFVGWIFAIVTSILSTWLRYEVTYREGLSTLLYYGISVDRLWKTANNSYILPSHRLTVYLMGILLGYYLRKNGKSLKMTTTQAAVGWSAATAAGLYSVFGPYQASYKSFTYDPAVAANYNAFAPVLWTAFICWAVLACESGRGGFFNDFISWKYFTIFTRISYAIYLTQFPVFFYNVGTERFPQYYKGFHSLFDFVEYGVILIASILLTLTFDIPFQELKKTLTAEPRDDSDSNLKTEGPKELSKDPSEDGVSLQKIKKRKRLYGT